MCVKGKGKGVAHKPWQASKGHGSVNPSLFPPLPGNCIRGAFGCGEAYTERVKRLGVLTRHKILRHFTVEIGIALTKSSLHALILHARDRTRKAKVTAVL